MSKFARPLTQRKAKVLIRDYLRETGRKGVSNLIQDISRHAKAAIFSQRALEIWLKEQDRVLQEHNWLILKAFIQSDVFKKTVPYAFESPSEQRLKEVAKGFIALYGTVPHPEAGLHVLPSTIEKTGLKATQILDGSWENSPNQTIGDTPRVICKIEPIDGERCAKFAYIAMFRSKQISATGLVIYLNSVEKDNCDYCHNFILHLWRRRDPESDSKLPSCLYHVTSQKRQPEFAISSVINSYFYKEALPLGASNDVLHAIEPDITTARAKRTHANPAISQFNWAENVSDKTSILLTHPDETFPEEIEIIDQLLEDVLPHGIA